ncbi:divergent polysaccharide deacetylase family protein [Sedimentitalea todarodis]|uniref:Divergent polysaccharide deacetylase family protein n=1 Tax=Sedimentitalea todarodis TaxID=1631240 RepID=A0ABU3VBR4_9RHOB|nr:divergent polysaccharide deacetylase family protein [Sedimentitalea todarodis]MDU9003615.1 divergent polysaccharide deacetylase family protein [Sedimentitalea todarodis]
MRGFLGGIVLGLILSGVGLASLSLLSPLAPAPEVTPEAVQPVAPTGDQAGIKGQPSDPEIAAAPPVSPVTSPPEAGDLTSIIQIDSATMDKPVVDATTQDPATPEGPAPLPHLPAPAETVDPTNTRVTAPDAPEQDSDVGVDTTEPDVPAADDLGAADIQFRSEPQAAEVADIRVTRDSEVGGLMPMQVTVGPNADATPQAVSDPAPQPDVATGPELIARSNGVTPKMPRMVESPPVVSAPQATVAPVLDAVTDVSDQRDPSLVRIAPLPQAGVATETTGPTIGTRVIPLTERHRAESTQASDPTRSASQTPLEIHAEPFENLDGKPLMSIIMVDDGSFAAFEGLNGLLFPVTIAIDPTLPDAPERMVRYRSAGHEVLVLANLPKFATARDVEVTLAAAFGILNESVGVLEGSGLQGDRDLSAQVVAVAKGTGRGLVTRTSGLNSTLKLAQGDGVPAAAVFREFDRAGPDPATIERSLDQAVFRASQDGSVTVIGRLHPATIRILQGWIGDHRASRVALAPVSAVLRLSDNGS